MHTSYSDTINIIRRNALSLENLVQLRTCAVQHDGVESHTIQETQAQRKFVDLVQDRASNFDDGKFGRLRRVRGRREDPQVSFNLTFCANRIQEACDSFLRRFSIPHDSGLICSYPVGLSSCLL